MSDWSDDLLLARLRRAASFMQEVRLAQAEWGKPLSGQSGISSDQRQAITSAADKSHVVAAVKEATESDTALHDLFERFEEMCRRRKFTVDADLRPALVSILAGEWFANLQAFDAAARDVVSVTVKQGALGPALMTDSEFERFRDTPCILTRAAVGYPSDPGGFLRKVGANIDALGADPEFERFRDVSSIFTRAVVSYPSDPSGFLRKMSASIDALVVDPEFISLRETPNIFINAALRNPSNPSSFLRKALTDACEL